MWLVHSKPHISEDEQDEQYCQTNQLNAKHLFKHLAGFKLTEALLYMFVLVQTIAIYIAYAIYCFAQSKHTYSIHIISQNQKYI